MDEYILVYGITRPLAGAVAGPAGSSCTYTLVRNNT